MDTAGAPAKHFQQSTELRRVTSQRTSLETRSTFHSISTTSPKLQCLKIKRSKRTLCQNSYPDGNMEQPVSCRLPTHLCTVGRFRYTVCTIRPLKLIVINMSHSCSDLYSWLLQIYCKHVQICTAAGYRYTVCMLRYIQPAIIDTPIIFVKYKPTRCTVSQHYFDIKIKLRNSASCWLLLYEYVTIYGPQNVKIPQYQFSRK